MRYVVALLVSYVLLQRQKYTCKGGGVPLMAHFVGKQDGLLTPLEVDVTLCPTGTYTHMKLTGSCFYLGPQNLARFFFFL